MPLSGLGLDRRARLKLLRLAKVYAFERGMAQYDSQDGILELTSERCPASKQNLDYLTYVLSVLTIESKVRPAHSLFTTDISCLGGRRDSSPQWPLAAETLLTPGQIPSPPIAGD